jgi:hypothetical protein
LLALGAKRGVPLVMPQLGEPVEPGHVERVSPWWRTLERHPPQPVAVATRGPVKVPTRLPWPFD